MPGRKFAIAFAARWRQRVGHSATISFLNARRSAASRIEASSFASSGGSHPERADPLAARAPPTASRDLGERDEGRGGERRRRSFRRVVRRVVRRRAGGSPRVWILVVVDAFRVRLIGKGAAGTRGAAGAPPSPSRGLSRACAVVPAVPARLGAKNTGPSAAPPRTPTSLARARSSPPPPRTARPPSRPTPAPRAGEEVYVVPTRAVITSSRRAMGAPSAPSPPAPSAAAPPRLTDGGSRSEPS